MALISGFSYGVLYIVLSTYSDMWTQQYHQSVEISGLHYVSLALGEIAGSQIGGPVMDFTYKKLTTRRNGVTAPEYHLPMMLPGTIVGSIGLFMYGWAAQNTVHWIVVDVGVFIAFFGMQCGSMPIMAYVIDAYPDHASSATAGSQFVRSLTAFAFRKSSPLLN
jgi:MFS family permease